MPTPFSLDPRGAASKMSGLSFAKSTRRFKRDGAAPGATATLEGAGLRIVREATATPGAPRHGGAEAIRRRAVSGVAPGDDFCDRARTITGVSDQQPALAFWPDRPAGRHAGCPPRGRRSLGLRLTQLGRNCCLKTTKREQGTDPRPCCTGDTLPASCHRVLSIDFHPPAGASIASHPKLARLRDWPDRGAARFGIDFGSFAVTSGC